MQRRRGFTLIEIMIVVAIVGVLAAIAIPNYLQQVLRSKQTEALVMMGNIKTGQLSFWGAHDCYAIVPPTPPGPPGPYRQTWTPAAPNLATPCSGANLSFEDLAVRPNGGTVYYSYSCAAEIPGVNGTATEFTCSALGDLDDDGAFYELLFCTDNDRSGAGINSPATGAACNFPGEPLRISVALY